MKYVPIRTSTLRPGAPLLFDVYVHYRDCYLKYKAATDRVEGGLLEKLRAKKVKKVYIPDSQEPSYLEYLDRSLETLGEGAQPVAERAELAQAAIRRESDSIGKALESEQEFRRSEARIQKVVDFFVAEPKALAGMLAAEGLSVDDSSHGSNVSALCLAIGSSSRGLGRDELTDLAVAGLLHDGGLRGLGFGVEATLETVAKEKRADFRRHPEIAVEMVAGKKFITPRVLRIIGDHEEFGEGLGFPGRKNYFRLQADSKVFNLCDAFDHHCVAAGKAGPEAIDSFIEARGEHFDQELLGLLEAKLKT